MKTKFTTRTLFLLTAVVAVIAAATSTLGLEVGIMGLFLGIANVVIFAQLFLDDKPVGTERKAWLIFIWLVIGLLTIVMLHGVFVAGFER